MAEGACGVKTLFNVRARTRNIGNDLIALGMSAVLHKVFGSDLNVVTVPAAGSGGMTGAGFSTCTVYDMNQMADGVIVGPGNLFENGGLDIDTDALAALQRPTMVFSVSMGRIFDRRGALVPRTDSLSADRTRALCAAAHTLLVRDSATLDHLNTLGSHTARLVGCPALFLGDVLPALPPAVPELADTVLISLRHPRLMNVPHSVQGRVPQEVRRIVDHFRGRGHDVRLLCHDYQDLSFAQTFPDVDAMYTEDSVRFLSWMRSCRLNVTFRLHGFLSCLVLGTLSIPITYDERTMSLIETIALKPWMVCFVHSPDVLADVRQRAEAPAPFDALKQQAEPVWAHLRTAMIDGVREFAAQVDAAGAGRRF